MDHILVSSATAKANGTSSTCSPAGATPTSPKGVEEAHARRPPAEGEGPPFDIALPRLLRANGLSTSCSTSSARRACHAQGPGSERARLRRPRRSQQG